MAVSAEEAKEIVESVFDFDHVGSEMLAVRKNLDSVEAQENLAEELVKAAVEEASDSSAESLAMITSAAKVRVAEFVKGAKFSQSGCSGK
jgi:hypothetical protein